MRSSESGEEELLLYLAGAQPWAERLRLFLRSRLDARLRGELRRLRYEARDFEREVRPGLAARLGASGRNPVAAGNRLPRAAGRGAGNAIAAWNPWLGKRRIAFAGIALSAILAGSVLAVRNGDWDMEGGRAYLTMAEGHPPRPMLILGY